MRKSARKTRKQIKRKKQKGGFYPSVMGGIGNAVYLAFPAAKLTYRMLNTRKQRKTRKTRK
jgi:hypothetical protein